MTQRQGARAIGGLRQCGWARARTCPAALRVVQRVVDNGRYAGLHDAEKHVLGDCFRSRDAQEALGTAKAAVPTVLAAAKGQALIQVRNAKADVSLA